MLHAIITDLLQIMLVLLAVSLTILTLRWLWEIGKLVVAIIRLYTTRKNEPHGWS